MTREEVILCRESLKFYIINKKACKKRQKTIQKKLGHILKRQA